MKFTDDQKKEIKEVLFHDLRYSVTNFDTLTITIGGGALALSLTFIGEIVPLKDAICIWILYTGMTLLTASVIASFFGHAVNISFLTGQLKEVIYKDEFDLKESPMTFWNKLIAWLTVLGVVALVAFVVINVNNERNFESRKQDSKGTTKTGFSDTFQVDSIRNDSSILKSKP